MKNPLTPAGIKPATFRLVSQYLNHCASAVPHCRRVAWWFFRINWITLKWFVSLPCVYRDTNKYVKHNFFLFKYFVQLHVSVRPQAVQYCRKLKCTAVYVNFIKYIDTSFVTIVVSITFTRTYLEKFVENITQLWGLETQIRKKVEPENVLIRSEVCSYS